MKRLFILLVASLLAGAAAQERIGDWLRQDIVDPFVDEEQIVLVIGPGGEAYSGEGAFFGLICKDGVVDVIYFRVDRPLPNNERRTLDYRVNSGEVGSADAWVNNGLVSLRQGDDDYEPFRDAVLLDGAEIAFATESSQGARLISEFTLPSLDDALEAIGCTR